MKRLPILALLVLGIFFGGADALAQDKQSEWIGTWTGEFFIRGSGRQDFRSGATLNVVSMEDVSIVFASTGTTRKYRVDDARQSQMVISGVGGSMPGSVQKITLVLASPDTISGKIVVLAPSGHELSDGTANFSRKR